MERVQITKLTLTNGKVIAHDDVWPRPLQVLDAESGGLKEIPAQARVGAIFWVETTTSMESWIEEEEEDVLDEAGNRTGRKKLVPVTHSSHTQTPGHYEVWAAPSPGSPLDRSGETRCIRVQREQVVDHEEAWPMAHAHAVVKARRDSTFLPDIGTDDDAGEGEGETPSNGASASAV
ncbi:MAG: hypothetical protein AMXMBFR56_62240 [Polyangiaceae bacterium]